MGDRHRYVPAYRLEGGRDADRIGGTCRAAAGIAGWHYLSLDHRA